MAGDRAAAGHVDQNGQRRHEQLGHSRQCRAVGRPDGCRELHRADDGDRRQLRDGQQRVPAARVGAAADQQPAERHAGRGVLAAAARDRRRGPVYGHSSRRPDASRRYRRRRLERKRRDRQRHAGRERQLQPDRFVYRFGQPHSAHAAAYEFLQHQRRRLGERDHQRQRGPGDRAGLQQRLLDHAQRVLRRVDRVDEDERRAAAWSNAVIRRRIERHADVYWCVHIRRARG